MMMIWVVLKERKRNTLKLTDSLCWLTLIYTLIIRLHLSHMQAILPLPTTRMYECTQMVTDFIICTSTIRQHRKCSRLVLFKHSTTLISANCLQCTIYYSEYFFIDTQATVCSESRTKWETRTTYSIPQSETVSSGNSSSPVEVDPSNWRLILIILFAVVTLFVLAAVFIVCIKKSLRHRQMGMLSWCFVLGAFFFSFSRTFLSLEAHGVSAYLRFW